MSIQALTLKDEHMRTFSRIGLVSAAIFSIASPVYSQQPSTPHSIVAASDGHAFSIKDARGRYLALHFLSDADSTECASFIRDYLAAASELAGVQHLFIRTTASSDAKMWASQFGDGTAMFLDSDGALARDLNVSSPFATVLLNTDGTELFRHAGKTHSDHMAWSAFLTRAEVARRRPSTADYNLPQNSTLAVDGYDLVAYFKSNSAVRGSPKVTSRYRGVSYQFASADNRRAFAADPERYLPTYGGWCASAMGAKGTKVEIDPTNFKIKGGRLFLFYKGTFSDALKDWNKHEKEWEPAADVNWQKLTSEAPYFPPPATTPTK